MTPGTLLGIRVLRCRMRVKCKSPVSKVEAEHAEAHGRARGLDERA